MSAANANPCLDMNIIWSPEGGLKFRIFRNKVQQLNYVVKVITTHTLPYARSHRES